jgi:hypothetical protein
MNLNRIARRATLAILLVSYSLSSQAGIIVSTNPEEGIFYSYLTTAENSEAILTVGACPQINEGQADCVNFFVGKPEELCEIHRKYRATRSTVWTTIKTIGGIVLFFAAPPIGVPLLSSVPIQVASSVASTGYDTYSSYEAWQKKCGGDNFVSELIRLTQHNEARSVKNGTIAPYFHHLNSLQDPSAISTVKSTVRKINNQYMIEIR